MRSGKSYRAEIDRLKFRLEAAHLTIDSILSGHFPWEQYNNACQGVSGSTNFPVELAITTLLKRNRGGT